MADIKAKINELRNIPSDDMSKSDIYTRYKVAFDKLLTLDDMSMPYGPGEALYDRDGEFEDEIGSVLTDTDDSISIVIGYGGVGKSTSLRCFFGYSSPGASFHGEDGETLVFAAHYNGHVSSGGEDTGHIIVREDLRQRISSACTFLEKRCGGLRERFISDRGQNEYYSYIEETNPQILENLSYTESITLSESEQRLKQLENANERDKFTCAATRLKYYLGCKECQCEKIVIILDDIEPLPYVDQRELVLQYSKFITCMKNRLEYLSEKPFTVNLIISMRPYSYMELNRDEAFKAFFVTRRIFKRNRIHFGRLLENKIKYYSPEIPHCNKDSWDEACNILSILTNKFGAQYSQMVKNLVLWNTRESVSLFKDILINRVWIQRNMDRSAAFTINENNYLFNNITVLRAIACGSSFVYRESENNPVPNILQNGRGKESWWFPILSGIMHFKPFLRTDYTYGSEPERAGDIYRQYEEIFPEMSGIGTKVRHAFSFLFKSHILMRGIDDVNTANSLDIQDDTLLHLSPRGYEIIRMAGNDSVYLELCREAVYRDYSDESRSPLASYELMRKGEQYLIFKDLLQLVWEMLEEEETYLRYAIEHGTLPQYVNTFGDEVISAVFVQGIENSIHYSGHGDDDRIGQIRGDVEMKINSMRALIRDRTK